MYDASSWRSTNCVEPIKLEKKDVIRMMCVIRVITGLDKYSSILTMDDLWEYIQFTGIDIPFSQ